MLQRHIPSSWTARMPQHTPAPTQSTRSVQLLPRNNTIRGPSWQPTSPSTTFSYSHPHPHWHSPRWWLLLSAVPLSVRNAHRQHAVSASSECWWPSLLAVCSPAPQATTPTLRICHVWQCVHQPHTLSAATWHANHVSLPATPAPPVSVVWAAPLITSCSTQPVWQPVQTTTMEATLPDRVNRVLVDVWSAPLQSAVCPATMASWMAQYVLTTVHLLSLAHILTWRHWNVSSARHRVWIVRSQQVTAQPVWFRSHTWSAIGVTHPVHQAHTHPTTRVWSASIPVCGAATAAATAPSAKSTSCTRTSVSSPVLMATTKRHSTSLVCSAVWAARPVPTRPVSVSSA